MCQSRDRGWAANAGGPAANPLPAPTVEFEGQTYHRLSGDQIRALIVGHYILGGDNSPHSVIQAFGARNVYSYSNGRDEVDGTYRILPNAVRIDEPGRSYDLYVYRSPEGDTLTGSYQDDGCITFSRSRVQPIID